MIFLPLAMSTPEDKFICLWGLDMETYSIMCAKTELDIANNLMLGSAYNVDYRLLGTGMPVVLILKFEVVESYKNENLKEIMDLQASNINAIRNLTGNGVIAKINKCEKINLGTNCAELILSFVGIRDKNYIVKINDWHWVEYWKAQIIYSDTEMIVEYFNSHNIYVFIDFCQGVVNGILNCSSMVVL